MRTAVEGTTWEAVGSRWVMRAGDQVILVGGGELLPEQCVERGEVPAQLAVEELPHPQVLVGRPEVDRANPVGEAGDPAPCGRRTSRA